MRHLCPPQSEHRLVDVLDHPEEADEQMAGRALLQNYWSFGLEIKSSERGQALKSCKAKSYVRHVVGYGSQDGCEVLVLIRGAGDPGLSFDVPRVKLGHVVDHDTDEGEVEVGHASLALGVLVEARVDVVIPQQVPDGVDRPPVDFRIAE